MPQTSARICRPTHDLVVGGSGEVDGELVGTGDLDGSGLLLALTIKRCNVSRRRGSDTHVEDFSRGCRLIPARLVRSRFWSCSPAASHELPSRNGERMNQHTTRLGAISVDDQSEVSAARDLARRGREKSSRERALGRVRMGLRCRKLEEDVVHQKTSAYRLKERLVKGKWVDNEVKEKEPSSPRV